MEYRPAGAGDARAIAALHADSWRRHYRGSFPDAYLDGEADADRRAVWDERLASGPADPGAATVVAVDGGEVVGFVHTIYDDDPVWGALVDNLHVTADRKGDGIGTALMARAAAGVLARPRPTGLYLWVLEANVAAQRFYAARGGVPSGDEWSDSPGGARVRDIRYAWADPSVLLD
ncbi:MAG TPA: GNAT family N-acetyltransferase [Acidimicrobiales bacterium]|nr:GNAT family N-acetyltransferase [Acidimicrobiales bacterium]